ncbi:formate dehydrogenase accessory sulfurtransferase FdhD [Lentzea sp. NEAU-D7]|jgi:FdhD protein|uniref:formate dehydrogenase accessory sulfurtransferase FdhD n=1 Tax=Lentzea sp. NEAU-D7 TaxID=2994667 RepID=UPI00224AB3D2|nr:formate dehydrogenase accessory sulfurtransferase FdhD [Lentzea sp. NEAU-D7]MCX2949546.1 formate dehydrogenase accessory sulfurtransferase FdhD [Lentzea sp. NEAU-D7]
MGRVTVRRAVERVSPSGRRRRVDALAAEEPLELRVNGKALAVTMRTPGQDVELAHGFLLSEGVIGSSEDISIARFCEGTGPDGMNTYNVLDIALAEGVPPPDTGVERNFYTTSSCGVCGKGALDAVKLKTRYSPALDEVTVTPEALTGFPDALRERQKVFESTGGLHAAGLFVDGELLVVREDVGRHNAVDKVLGWAVLQNLVPLRGAVLMVSGRASFELVQKAAMSGIPVLAAVSAPSSLAVELAEEQGMTLIGFLRGDSMNVYTGGERVVETA